MVKRKKREINLRSWLIPKLRRISYQWPPRKSAKDAARISRGKYKCASCEGTFGHKEIYLDHIDPVVPPEGFDKITKDLSENKELLTLLKCNKDEFSILFYVLVFLARLLVKTNYWQVLCKQCHDIKTDLENELRKDIKSKKNLDKIKKI